MGNYIKKPKENMQKLYVKKQDSNCEVRPLKIVLYVITPATPDSVIL